MSYTSELRDHPIDRPYVTAGVSAVTRAHHAPVHMGQFGAAESTADFCTGMVARCDVFVGLIGLCYGTPVPQRPDLSHVELEFETATRCGLRRLIFLIHEDVAPRHRCRLAKRQLAFRRRLLDSGLMVATVMSPYDLELQLFQSLIEQHGG